MVVFFLKKCILFLFRKGRKRLEMNVSYDGGERVLLFSPPKGDPSDRVPSLNSDMSQIRLFTGMVKYIMKFNKETGKTAKLVQQSG